jgi:hypothetical protein
MKLDELEKMAQQTAAYGVHPSGEFIYSFYTEQLQAFAKLIAEHERNECLKFCDEVAEYFPSSGFVGSFIGSKIKARGQA